MTGSGGLTASDARTAAARRLAAARPGWSCGGCRKDQRRRRGCWHAYARRRTQEPDDVVAEVFATAWRHRVRVPDDPVAWLLRTASRQVLHALRAGGRRQRLADRAFGQGPVVVQDHADQVAGRYNASEIVIAALPRLSAADQEVPRLAAWEDPTPQRLPTSWGAPLSPPGCAVTAPSVDSPNTSTFTRPSTSPRSGASPPRPVRFSHERRS